MERSKGYFSVKNLKYNWYFPPSAMALFCLFGKIKPGYLTGLVVTFVIVIAFSARVPSVWKFVGKASRPLRIWSFLMAVGICAFAQAFSLNDWTGLLRDTILEELLGSRLFTLLGLMCFTVALAALPAVYLCVLLFWKRMVEIFTRRGTFRGLCRAEWVIIGLLLSATLLGMGLIFARSEAFYGTEYIYDIIYTSDTPFLVKENVYMALTHKENDIRQPLFAVFASPFMGIPYLLSRVFGGSATLRAALLNAAQIVMLFAANLMLTKMMKLGPAGRIAFMTLSCFTYTQLLFVLMMEQYVVAYFWLVFCVYLVAEEGKPDRMVLWGAGGTLLTSMIFLPCLSEKSPLKDFRAWFLDMVKYGFEFVAVVLAFCRLDTIFLLTEKLILFGSFTGRDVTFTDKLRQYTAFVRNLFAAPAAGVDTIAAGHISWQLREPTEICIAGVVVLLLAVISAVWNREKKSSRLAAFWVCFSVFMLLLLGWGTYENGLILYALYFGWAFLVLLYQLAEKIGEVLKLRFLAPVCALAAVPALAAINLPAVWEMLTFAFTYYPI